MKAGVAGLSGTLALVLLLPMEAGVPIPVPADLVMFTVGERVAAGEFPLWVFSGAGGRPKGPGRLPRAGGRLTAGKLAVSTMRSWEAASMLNLCRKRVRR